MPKNGLAPILETLAGMETEVNEFALENAKLGMDVMPSGKVIEVSAVLSNADIPIDETLSGIEIDANELADENAWAPMLVKFSGNEIAVNPVAF